MRVLTTAAAGLLAAAVTTPCLADAQHQGCFVPIRGFATSLCTDAESCSTQAGIYRIVLRNMDEPIGQRRLVISGTFQGEIVAMPNADCGGATAAHVLNGRDPGDSISTGPDVGCFTGVGDFVNNVEIVETMVVKEGSGIYANVIPGGQVTMTGQLGLKSGINRFKVTPAPEDEVCFGTADPA
jgi:hypothetical protein